MTNQFGAKSTLRVGDRDYEIFRLDRLEDEFAVSRLPNSLKVLLENLLRHDGSSQVAPADVVALAGWQGQATREIAFRPARVLMQDFTGVPAVVDLAAMRDAMATLGGGRLDPLLPVDLVIDHSVTVDAFGGPPTPSGATSRSNTNATPSVTGCCGGRSKRSPTSG